MKDNPRALTKGTVNQAGGTVTTANTFQSVMVREPRRIGGLIYNSGAANLLVFIGPIANATTGGALPLIPGATLNLATLLPGVVITDQVSVTSATAGNAFMFMDTMPTS
jgi:hypothetical protein